MIRRRCKYPQWLFTIPRQPLPLMARRAKLRRLIERQEREIDLRFDRDLCLHDAGTARLRRLQSALECLELAMLPEGTVHWKRTEIALPIPHALVSAMPEAGASFHAQENHPEVVALEEVYARLEREAGEAEDRRDKLEARLHDADVPFEEKVDLRHRLTTRRGQATRARKKANGAR